MRKESLRSAARWRAPAMATTAGGTVEQVGDSASLGMLSTS